MSLTPAQTRALHGNLAGHLVEIGRLFKNPKITLIIRAPDLQDGDVVMTDDTFDEAKRTIDRAAARGLKTHG